ncbi:MAG: putative quinol monooxygenase [Desulfobacterales bacterium]
MFVVTVEFSIHQQHEREFQETVLKQARNSLTLETDCHRFDVSIDAKDGGRVFLYELYTDEAAYQAHRQTPHYHEFSTRIADWVAQKNIQTWQSLYPD